MPKPNLVAAIIFLLLNISQKFQNTIEINCFKQKGIGLF